MAANVADLSTLRLSVSIARVSVDGLKFVVLFADFLLNFERAVIVMLSDLLVSSGRIGGSCVAAVSSEVGDSCSMSPGEVMRSCARALSCYLARKYCLKLSGVVSSISLLLYMFAQESLQYFP